ncbi:MAG: thioredoxin family protein, partial [Nocardioides sp.]
GVTGTATAVVSETALAGTAYAGGLGTTATLVQFSSAFCAPCRAARRVLDEVAKADPGIAHLELDVAHHLELVRRFAIIRTPTTVVLNADGFEVSRASGVPTNEQVSAALRALS